MVDRVDAVDSVDTGLPGPEEFPVFTDFWIEQPSDDHVITHALLDGPSLAGAYAIDTWRHEGVDVLQDVRCALFLRRDVQRLGIAPQTSMFLYDQTRADGAGTARLPVRMDRRAPRQIERDRLRP